MPEPCKTLYIYPDGSFTGEAVKGLEPLLTLTLCGGEIVVNTGSGEERISLARCIEELEGLERENGLISYSGLFNRLGDLVEKCGGLGNLELALALFTAPYRLDDSKKVIDVLLQGG